MSLYLCIFDGEEELEGLDVGHYSDFAFFRDTVTELLEGGNAGSRFPTLILHSDSDGEWTPAECRTLKAELAMISDELRGFPAIPFRAEWQRELGESFGLRNSSLHDSFIDVDGEPLLERLDCLCDVAIESGQPIRFQ